MKKIVGAFMIFFSGIASGVAQVDDGGAASFGKQSQSLSTPAPPPAQTPPAQAPADDNAARPAAPESTGPMTSPSVQAAPAPAPLSRQPLAAQSGLQYILARPLLGLGLGSLLASFGLNADQSSLVSALLMVLILTVLALWLVILIFRKPVVETPASSAEPSVPAGQAASETPRVFVTPALAQGEPLARSEAPVETAEPVVTPVPESAASRKAGTRRETISGREAAARRKAAAPQTGTTPPAFLPPLALTQPPEATRTPEMIGLPEATRPTEATRPPEVAQPPEPTGAPEVVQPPEPTVPPEVAQPAQPAQPPAPSGAPGIVVPHEGASVSLPGSPAELSGTPEATPAPESTPVPAPAATPSAPGLPAGFDVAGFLAGAQSCFRRMQAAWDRADINDIRQFTSTDMFNTLQAQLQQRDPVAASTEVLSLDAELLGLDTIADLTMATVRFTGTMKEAPEAAQAHFSEVWNLSRPVAGDAGWVLAGIQ